MKKLIFLIISFLVTSSLEAMESQEELGRSLGASWVITDPENAALSETRPVSPVSSIMQPDVVVYKSIPEIEEESPAPLPKPLEEVVLKQILKAEPVVQEEDNKHYTKSTFKAVLEIFASYRLQDSKSVQFVALTTAGITITVCVIGLAYKIYKK